MAKERGGYADKIGNSYESLWAVRQLLHLINEDCLDVTIEPIGADEAGVDIWVTKPDHTRIAYQCKVSNGNKNEWSIADLNSKGVLGHAAEQLGRDPNIHFALVSPVGNRALHDICESARHSNRVANDFYQHQILNSQTRTRTFQDFCNYLDLSTDTDTDTDTDLAKAHSYLSRFELETWSDTYSSAMELETLASFLIDAQPTETIAILTKFAADNLRQKITSHDLLKHFEKLGHAFRNLAFDKRLAPRLRLLQGQFKNSINGNLIAGELVERSETQEILQALTSNPLVVLHGRPGFGKSAVLLELTQTLDEQNYTYLPVRLDRQIPTNSTRQFGLDLGLPESPAICLAPFIHSDKPCVLLLDQLDALRWTSNHSKTALEVCKSLVSEVLFLREQGKKVHIVLSCRTYDLEHDPELSAWVAMLSKGAPAKVEVKPLPDETVQSIAKRIGVATVPDKLLSILKSPQHLAMWVELVNSGIRSGATNRTQLMSDFWVAKYQEAIKLGVDEQTLKSEISEIANYMERTGYIHAPIGVVSSPPSSAIDALLEIGVLQSSNGKFTFSHQSYLDFFIAQRLVQQIFSLQRTVSAWLGNRENQTLFKREQLRQALTLLSEQSSETFLDSIKEILFSDSVRFHLKHLALEVTGNIGTPSNKLCHFCFKLYADPFWKKHILETVYFNHAPYIDWLNQQEKIHLHLIDEITRSDMLIVLRSVSKSRADLVTQVLEPFIDHGTLSKQIINSLNWDSFDDSERMFSLRLKLAERGQIQQHTDWKKTPSNQQIQLLEAILKSFPDNYFDSDDFGFGLRSKTTETASWRPETFEHLKPSALSCPELVWNKLLPQIIRLLPLQDSEPYAFNIWLDKDREYLRQGLEAMPSHLVALCSIAGRELAAKNSEIFWQDTESLRTTNCSVIQLILTKAYCTVDAQYADAALEWMLDSIPSLAVGSGYYEPKWQPIAELISALSPACSRTLFTQLEKKIYFFKTADFIESAKYWLSTWRQGYYGVYWGHAQYFLLPVLAENRRSKKTNELIQVLLRKFKDYDDDDFLRIGKSRGGTVHSSIPRERVSKVSDRAWLAIINNSNLPNKRSFEYRKNGIEGLRVSSIEYFSQDMEFAAKCEPTRFANLALHFPAATPSAYKTAIIEALSATKVNNDIPDQFKENWQPADHQLVLEVLEAFKNETSADYPRRFSWLVTYRSDCHWPQAEVDKLINFALHHHDPEAKKLNIHCDKNPDEVGVNILESNAINCVRGVATQALGQLLWEHHDLHPLIKSVFLKIANDSHPAVLTALLKAIRQCLNDEQDFVVELFSKLTSTDIRLAASSGGINIFNCCAEAHHRKLHPIVGNMLASNIDKIQSQGAQEVTARWLFLDLYTDELQQCLTGTAAHRKGVAHIAARFACNNSYQERCHTLIAALKNDTEKNVRQEIRHLVYEEDLYKTEQGQMILADFIDSRSFEDDPSNFLHQLESNASNILPFAGLLLKAGASISSSERENSSNYRQDMYYFSPLLIRLYDQALEQGEAAITDQCLDIWDSMFINRISSVREITKTID